MPTAKEKKMPARWDSSAMMGHFETLAGMKRRSDGEGEERARTYILEQLEEAGISCRTEFESAFLSFGGRASVRFVGAAERETGEEIRGKAWNFSVCTPREGIQGRAVVLDKPSDFPSSPLDYLTSDERRGSVVRDDLKNGIVLAPVSSPHAVLDAQSRGALAFVICWPEGEEEEIHESGSVLWWGLPMPEEGHWQPTIPVIAVNKRDGETLMQEAKKGNQLLQLTSDVVEKVAPIHLVEAFIPPTNENVRHYLLVGAHLDSKHYGATDNATGAALALSLAEELSRLESRRWGVRICWWSGHEFARYTGSSLYARSRFADLERHCLAYCNIDMPGLKGASDFTRLTAGPDLLELAFRTVRDVTSQQGMSAGRIRAWDQSFQNMGISSFFVWSSQLPQGSPYRTGQGNMPRWWHTEADTAEYCDPEIFAKDFKVYMAGLSRLLQEKPQEPLPLDVLALWRAVEKQLEKIDLEIGSGAVDLARLRKMTAAGRQGWEKGEPGINSPEKLSLSLKTVRLLNRIYLSARGAHLQDWSGGNEFIPGLSEACAFLAKGSLSPRREVIIRNYAETQCNRIYLLLRELLALIGIEEEIPA